MKDTCEVGAFILDLYCMRSSFVVGVGQGTCVGEKSRHGGGICRFGGHNRANCRKQARGQGWIVRPKAGVYLCPECAKEEV